MTICKEEFIYAIFATSKCILTTRYTVNNLLKLSLRYIIICPRNDYFIIKSNINVSSNFIFDDELENYSLKQKLQMVEHSKKGWYKQQLLKSTFWLKEKCSVIIIDGDTAISKRILLEVRLPQLLHTTKEVNESYNRLLTFNQLPIPRRSTVCNFGLFPNNDAIKKLYSEIELNYFSNYNLYNKELDIEFSEYLLIGSLKFYTNLSFDYKKLKIFRRAELLNNKAVKNNNDNAIINMMEKYDVIAFEQGHKIDRLRIILASFLYKISYSW